MNTKFKRLIVKDKKNRFHLIDALRGLAIVNMILYHFCYDWFVVYGRDELWYQKPAVHIWQQGIGCAFVFLAGFSWNFGKKKNWLRGLFINACGIVITIATGIIVPDEIVWFGILTFMGCAILAMIPLDLLWEKITITTTENSSKKAGAYIGAAVSIFLFILFYNVSFGTLGLFNWFTWKVPRAIYECKIFTPFGFRYSGFSSGDFYGFFPWFFLFLAGYFFYGIFNQFESWKKAAKTPVPGLAFIGRWSIWIYLVHQPLLMLFCEMVNTWGRG